MSYKPLYWLKIRCKRPEGWCLGKRIVEGGIVEGGAESFSASDPRRAATGGSPVDEAPRIPAPEPRAIPRFGLWPPIAFEFDDGEELAGRSHWQTLDLNRFRTVMHGQFLSGCQYRGAPHGRCECGQAQAARS